MKITVNKDHYLFENEKGSYHLSFEEYEKLGKEKAQELAEKEIERKLTAKYTDATIDFTRARELGFCEYGIQDFCEKLELDIEKEYSIANLYDKLTLDVFKSYPNECLTLFGKGVVEKFGGVIGLLEGNKSDSSVFYLVVDNFVDDSTLHKFSVVAAYYSLNNFEKEFPEDKRPRLAIEAKEKFIKGGVTEEELSAAESAANSAASSAARSAASSAAWSARSAAWSAAESAANSAAWAAESAARSAAESARSAASSAAWSATYEYFSEELIKLIKETK